MHRLVTLVWSMIGGVTAPGKNSSWVLTAIVRYCLGLTFLYFKSQTPLLLLFLCLLFPLVLSLPFGVESYRSTVSMLNCLVHSVFRSQLKIALIFVYNSNDA